VFTTYLPAFFTAGALCLIAAGLALRLAERYSTLRVRKNA
jgi:hypothetical protein